VVGIATSRRINVERASRLCLLLDWTCYRRKTSRADDNFTELEVRKKQNVEAILYPDRKSAGLKITSIISCERGN
jgi:hypothetical protein